MNRAEAIAEAIRSIGANLDGECVVIHRDLGDGFPHRDEPDCPCSPIRRVVLPGTDPAWLAADIAREERESEA